jgi:hypothetical protein
MFAALASHPEVKDLAEVSAEKGEQMNKQAGQLFVELLTKRCHNESIQAVQYEGEKAIESSFNLLGQVAGQSLMTHPDVVEFMGGLARHVDQKAIEQAFGKK